MALLGCGTWIKNPDSGPTPPKDGQVSVRVETQRTGASGEPTSADAPVVVVDKNGQGAGSLTLNQAFMLLKEMKLRPVGKKEVRLAGPSLANLMTGEISPAFTGTVPADTYGSIVMTMARLAAPDQMRLGAPADMAGYAVWVDGTLKEQSGASKTFKLKIDTDGEFPIASETPDATVVIDKDNPLQLDFDLNVEGWFEFSGTGVDFSMIEGSEVELSSASTGNAKLLYDAVLKNFQKSVTIRTAKKKP